MNRCRHFIYRTVYTIDSVRRVYVIQTVFILAHSYIHITITYCRYCTCSIQYILVYSFHSFHTIQTVFICVFIYTSFYIGLSVSMHMYIAQYLAANQKCKNNSQSTFCCLSTCSLCYDNKVESNLIYSEQKWRVHHKTSSWWNTFTSFFSYEQTKLFYMTKTGISVTPKPQNLHRLNDYFLQCTMMVT